MRWLLTLALGLPTVAAAENPTPPPDDAAVDARLGKLATLVDGGGVLPRADLDFLMKLAEREPARVEAHRLLAAFFLRYEDYRRESLHLEAMLAVPGYAQDHGVLMALVRSYARRSRFESARRMLSRAESLALRTTSHRIETLEAEVWVRERELAWACRQPTRTPDFGLIDQALVFAARLEALSPTPESRALRARLAAHPRRCVVEAKRPR